MGALPDSALSYYAKNPEATFTEYLAEVMAGLSQVKFTDSLRGQDNLIVPLVQIESATNLAPHGLGGNWILQVSETTVLKVGWRVTMPEAEALILLAAKTIVPVPTVLSAYMIGDVGFILMTKIEGGLLASCLDTMSREELQGIARQLKSYILEWRELRSSFLGTVTGGPCQDILFRHPWDYKSTKQYGPFHFFTQYRYAVVEALRLSRPEGVWYEKEEKLKERILSFGDERTTPILGVMTHGDLHPGNIFIKDGGVSGIIDWGEAGYSLPERESFAANRIAMDPAWVEMIHACIPSFPEENELWDEVDRSMMRYSPL
ncbi:aminoglycoside phosphotransferase family protein [Aspergillus ibericus CBS 121593]|uniref:Kinase-like protein n=1 Tax=Aspergillus ibericus CBS 121593 TaxID=1448316 RepID=A0A395H6P3_9EURO|nr:kinase-like protein [Aspergillus ibericus CBS 121593]RAL03601.1 kinase-like protein [Aspergillus ibericus CBS 121593]